MTHAHHLVETHHGFLNVKKTTNAASKGCYKPAPPAYDASIPKPHLTMTRAGCTWLMKRTAAQGFDSPHRAATTMRGPDAHSSRALIL